jgi:FSR family fosmidomycin resistance protein-like MFS transporter
VASSQLHLFLFLGAVAAGTFFGGPIGDRIGRKAVIWFSILGVAPFTLALPYADLFWTTVLSVVIGFILGLGVLGHRGVCAGTGAGQRGDDRRDLLRLDVRLWRHRRGAAGVCGRPAWHRVCVRVCSFLPLFGLAAFLPLRKRSKRRAAWERLRDAPRLTVA